MSMTWPHALFQSLSLALELNHRGQKISQKPKEVKIE